MKTSRRELLKISLVLGGASALGCSTTPAPVDAPTGGTDAPTGGTDAPVAPTDSGPFVCGSVGGTISANHGHELTVPLADVTTGTDQTYDIMGTSTHSHSITVTSAQFAMLAAGMDVVVTSTSGSAHTHMVTVRCAAA